jgi:glycosyltransferase involved in cell wall biosynthesis|nr:glycosyltransferase family 2 protein [Candidatus Krumholzibacteria bacterium]
MVSNPGLSVVVPVYNEQECIGPLLDEIRTVIQAFPVCEVLVVDDGSADATAQVLGEKAKDWPALRVITFQKNAGQSAAMACGFRLARFDHVVAMDGDSQSDPADIPRIAELLADYPLVCGYRAQRRDSRWKRWGSLWANNVRRRVTGDEVIDIGCSLKGFHRAPLQRLYFFDGSHRFLPVLMTMEGCSMTQIPVHHRARAGGTSKYGNLDRLARTWQDLLGMRWMQSRRIDYLIKDPE